MIYSRSPQLPVQIWRRHQIPFFGIKSRKPTTISTTTTTWSTEITNSSTTVSISYSSSLTKAIQTACSGRRQHQRLALSYIIAISTRICNSRPPHIRLFFHHRRCFRRTWPKTTSLVSIRECVSLRYVSSLISKSMTNSGSNAPRQAMQTTNCSPLPFANSQTAHAHKLDRSAIGSYDARQC